MRCLSHVVLHTFAGLPSNFASMTIWPVRWFVFFVTAMLAGVCFGKGLSRGATSNEDVLRIARSFKDGGKYNWSGSGTPEAIIFSGAEILPEGNGTYCSGFTFTVVMRAAAERGLLNDKSVGQIRAFQQEWYGATARSSEIQAAFAMKNLRIGRSVNFSEAQPGDFIQFWRTKKGGRSGHSVIFLGWIEEKGKNTGFRYRSTQESTDGIGDKLEYFSDAPGHSGFVIRKRSYFARLNSK
jgi:cell wall-associated NlpC family hydrolase